MIGVELDVLIEAPIEPRPYRKQAMAIPLKNGGGHRAMVFTSKETERWQDQFAAIAAIEKPAVVIDEPVRVDVLLVMPRPKRLMRRADPDGLVFAPGKPDADNCRKAVLDALRSWWRDDSLVVAGQTVRVHAEKAGAPRTVVRIRSLTNVDPASIIGPVFGELTAPPKPEPAPVQEGLFAPITDRTQLLDRETGDAIANTYREAKGEAPHYRCASPECPGLPYRASDIAHPPNCGQRVDAGDDDDFDQLLNGGDS